mgnify:CR=1 FL=1
MDNPFKMNLHTRFSGTLLPGLKVGNVHQRRLIWRRPGPRKVSHIKYAKPFALTGKGGSALLLTLLIVSLLMIMVLSFVVTVRLELRTIIVRQELAQAKSQAKLALNLAIGQLQYAAGDDKRVTGTADLAGFTGANQHPHWTGVWQSNTAQAPTWLVSGNAPLPASPGQALDTHNSVILVPADTLTPGSIAVRAPLQTMPQPIPGNIAWWTGDEGVKARVDVVRPLPDTTLSPTERILHSQSPREPDLISLEGAWATASNAALFARNATAAQARLASRETVGMAASGLPFSTLFHDVTVNGYGLPVNVNEGGLKPDWSVILDRSMEGTPLVEYYLGARPTQSPPANEAFHPADYKADIWAFPESQIYNPDRFFLSSRIGSEVDVSSRRPGPNLGILWHYGRLWGEVTNNQTPLVGNHPKVESDIRNEDWFPYKSANRDTFASDQQHTNSAITPIISHLQIGLRLRSALVGPNTPGSNQYKLQVEYKPVIGLWNPYTVGIKGDLYKLDWLATPMVRLRITPPAPASPYETTTWLRVLNWSGTSWKIKDHWMQLQTPENIDFQPGEVRMFSLSSLSSRTDPGHITMTPKWSSAGAILFDLMTGKSTASLQPIVVPEGSQVEALEVYLQDTQHPETQAAGFSQTEETTTSWVTLKARSQEEEMVVISRYTGLWNGGIANQEASASVATVPARILPSASNRVSEQVENLVTGDFHMATWAIHLRTTTQMTPSNQRIRGWIDTDPRAVVNVSRWDGSRETSGAVSEGWNFTPAFMGGTPYDNLPPATTDGFAQNNRGLVSVGPGAQQAPQMDTTDPQRYRGYMGASNTPLGGYTHLPLFDIPTAPLVSVGQFQHAQLGRYSFEPGFVAGNSYANVRIPLEQTAAYDFNGISGLNFYDISYDVNRRIWDQMYFSTMAPDYVGGGMSFNEAFAGRLDRLPNPRMVYVPGREDTSLDTLIASAGIDGQRGAEALSSRIRILGAFNINSTSKTAWKAVLSSMVTAELPVVDPLTRALSWENPEGIRFNRFGHVLSSQPYLTGEGDHEGFWMGWRQLDADELDALAEAIVEEVKARGPFRSMGEFVNRDPDSDDVNQRRKGALQAALDRTVNPQGSALPDDLGRKAQKPNGSQFSNAVDNESEAAGFASYILQGDLLQSLAPILQARSDTFVIRAYGDRGTEAAPSARAWCEAVVQRTADYLIPTNAAWENQVDDTLDPRNAVFGRRFKIVSFRWLNASEIEEM